MTALEHFIYGMLMYVSDGTSIAHKTTIEKIALLANCSHLNAIQSLERLDRNSIVKSIIFPDGTCVFQVIALLRED